MAKGARGATATLNTNPPVDEPPLSKKLAATNGPGRGRRPANGNTATGKESSTHLNGIHEQNGKLTNGVSTSSNNQSKGQLQNPWLANTTRQTLHDYRRIHRLPICSSHISPRASAVLNSGIGLQSPTMARPRAKRRIPKEVLAQAVRKHFNALAVNESEAVANTLYVARTTEKDLRLRFPATRPGVMRL